MTDGAAGAAPVRSGPGAAVIARERPTLRSGLLEHLPLGSPPSADLPSRSLTSVRRTVHVVLLVQAMVLCAVSTVQFDRFVVGQDFAAYVQVLWKIAHGHLNPTSSLFGVPFWRNDGEFATWPLAELLRIYPHPVALLWLQDLALVATEWLTIGWIVDILSESSIGSDRRRSLVLCGATGVLVLNPMLYDTAAYDFHFEPLLGLLAVAAARSLWSGRTKRLWWLAPALLLVNVPGGLCLAGLGVAGVHSGRTTRRMGIALAAIGLGWVALMTWFGASGLAAQSAVSGYGYLTGQHGGAVHLWTVVAAIVRHPTLVATMFGHRWLEVCAILACGGLVGILSPWALWPSVMLMTPAVLYADPSLLDYSFQSWPIVPLVVVGSVLIVVRHLDSSLGHRRRIAGSALALTAVGCVGICTSVRLPTVLAGWLPVSSQAAATIEAAADPDRLPPGTEVIASMSLVGRYAQRDAVYPMPFQDHPVATSASTFPVHDRKVLFVVSYQQSRYQWNESALEIRSWIHTVEWQLRARLITASSGVYVLQWTPPPGTRAVSIARPS